MTDADKTRIEIEKEAAKFAGSHYTRNHFPKNWNDRYQSYIAGATAWAERLKIAQQQYQQKVDHRDKLIEQERNKAIDECIEYFGEHYRKEEEWTTIEIQKELEWLKSEPE